MHHVPGRCAPFRRCPWTDVVVHAPRPRCRTSEKGVRFQRSGCRTANGQGVVFDRHIQHPSLWLFYHRTDVFASFVNRSVIVPYPFSCCNSVLIMKKHPHTADSIRDSHILSAAIQEYSFTLFNLLQVAASLDAYTTTANCNTVSPLI